MNRRNFIKMGMVGPALAAIPARLWAGPPSAGGRPNFLIIVSDDQGSRSVGYRDPAFCTPALDALAADGLRCDRAYSSSPLCCPTRYGIQTGRQAARVQTAALGTVTPPGEVFLPRMLAAAGYRTGFFGKWHIQGTPTYRGYDEALWSGNYFDMNPTFTDTAGARVPTTGEGSQVTADAAVAFVIATAKARQPFLAMVCFGSPHAGHRSFLPEDLDACGGNRYRAEVRAMDRAIGRLREAVRAAGVERETLIWFASDNGEAGKNPFRGAKGGIWEGGLRIPMSLTWPGHIAAGRGSEAPVCTYDILPTLCGLAGVKPSPAGGVLDGVDIGPLLSGDWHRPQPICIAVGAPAQDLAAWRGKPRPPRTIRAVLAPDRPVPLPGEGDDRGTPKKSDEPPAPHATVVDGTWKLNRWYTAPGKVRDELYDLAADPREQRDVAAAQPQVFQRLCRELDRWLDGVERSQSGADYAQWPPAKPVPKR
jgi:hypothetical protein